MTYRFHPQKREKIRSTCGFFQQLLGERHKKTEKIEISSQHQPTISSAYSNHQFPQMAHCWGSKDRNLLGSKTEVKKPRIGSNSPNAIIQRLSQGIWRHYNIEYGQEKNMLRSARVDSVVNVRGSYVVFASDSQNEWRGGMSLRNTIWDKIFKRFKKKWTMLAQDEPR